MRHFFCRQAPEFRKILIVESGSRRLTEGVIAHFYQTKGEHIQIDLVTCFAGVPQGFEGGVFRIADYSGRAGRKRLYRELAERQYSTAGIICSGESIMTKWKWALVARVPTKFFVLNENGDYFWVDWGHWRVMIHFVLFRAGLTGAAAIPTLGRLLFFPATLAWLLFYAGFVHLRRKVRML